MTSPKVSIIATFYNLEEYAKRCIDSLTSQTLQEIEIICINDGSKDNTLKVLQELANNDNRIKIIDKKNEGVSIARNIGINVASGEYIMFVDGDDFLDIDTSERAYNKAVELNVDIVIFQKKYIKKNKSINCEYFQNSPFYSELIDTPYQFFDKIPQTFKSVHAMYCWDKLYKTSFIKKSKALFPIDINCAEDNIFIIQLYVNNPKIVIMNNYFYNYLATRPLSLTKMDRLTYVDIHINVYLQIQKYLKKNLQINSNNYISELHLYIYNYYLNVLLDEWNNIYFTKNRKEYLKKLKVFVNSSMTINNHYPYMNGYKRAKNLFLLDNYHIYEMYWFVFRPILKYCLVHPYRFLRNIIQHI